MSLFQEAPEKLFESSCRRAAEYPKNNVQLHYAIYDYRLNEYFEQLNRRSKQLFCEEPNGSLDIWQYNHQLQEFRNTCASGIHELRGELEGASVLDKSDPRCRFVFVHAANSRDRLKTSRRMLMYVLTYLQVMPSFLDYIFPFGWQEYAQDFHFSGFQEDTRLAKSQQGLRISKLGRSGKDVRLCYTIKSVEPSKDQRHWPWSIRQVAVYHSFDVESGNACWIIVKGDQLMKNRIQSATSSKGNSELKSFNTIGVAFAASLGIHLLFSDWSTEHWRWYINFLEEELQAMTRRDLAITEEKVLDKKREQVSGVQPKILEPTRKGTFRLQRAFTSPILKKVTSFQMSTLPSPPPPPPPSFLPTSLRRQFPPQLPPQLPPPPPSVLPQANMQDDMSEEQGDFSFVKIQNVQEIEEKANEVLLILNANIRILTEINEHYIWTTKSEYFHPTLASDCKEDIARFGKRLSSIISDLRMQCARVEVLLCLIAGRKSLVRARSIEFMQATSSTYALQLYGILDYRNIGTNRLLAKRSQQSAERMERMTDEMNKIAKKTEQETVSMKIITLVTLFFLPGTFMSTIMSTDIVRFEMVDGNVKEIFQQGALNIYLAATLPLMLFTFGAWALLYWWANWKHRGNGQ